MGKDEKIQYSFKEVKMESNQVLKRSEVPIEQTWNLEKIFPTVAAWEEALESIDDQINDIKNMRTPYLNPQSSCLNV